MVISYLWWFVVSIWFDSWVLDTHGHTWFRLCMIAEKTRLKAQVLVGWDRFFLHFRQQNIQWLGSIQSITYVPWCSHAQVSLLVSVWYRVGWSLRLPGWPASGSWKMLKECYILDRHSIWYLVLNAQLSALMDKAFANKRTASWSMPTWHMSRISANVTHYS